MGLGEVGLDTVSVGDRARRRISRRLIPYLLLLFLLAFIDRSNVGIAAKMMKADLGFTDAVVGLGAGIFFLGYFLLEIPGTLIVERWSARKWIARIMVTWGIIASLMGFIGLPIFSFLHPQSQFYSLRFILGLAEAGFFPGVIVYLSHWFLYADRAKTKSLFLIGIPLASIISNPLSTWIMNSVKWMELAGWRWVFILEGIPAVLIGFVTWYFLTDRPEQAKWLPDDEKAWLVAEIDKEHQAKVKLGGDSIKQSLRSPQVWLLAGIYFFGITGMYGFTFFLPAVADKMKETSNAWYIVTITLPYILGLIAMIINGNHSDRTGERRWHTAIPLLLASVAMGLAGYFAGNPPIAAGCLCLLGVTLYPYLPAFWTHPTSRLTASSAAFAVGLINSIGNLGGYVGPMYVGKLKTDSGNYQSGLYFLAGCILIAGLLSLMLTQKAVEKGES